MKHAIMSVIAVAIILSFAGCQYFAPVSEEHTIAIDPSIIGLWEEVPEGDKPPDPAGRMLILKYSDTEYLVHYPIRKDDGYYRAYPVKIDGISCVQIQLIGTADGDVKKGERKFQVATYTVSNGELEIKTLNTDLVDKDLGDTASIKQAFLKNKDNKDLFSNPGKFRKIREKS
jgi:hypothetical protein